MKEPSIHEKLATLIGFVGSAGGFVWLVVLPNKPPLSDLISRLGLIAALFSCLWMATLCWAACFAYISKRRNWSSQGCRFAGIPFWIAAVLFFFLGKGQSFFTAGSLLFIQALFASDFARRFAFPEITAEQAATPPPPITLFPK